VSTSPEEGDAPGRAVDHGAVARATALAMLTGAPRSRAQLAQAMAEKDVPPEVADAVLDRYVEVGLIDDAEYARILVRSRHANRGLSRRALALELSHAGIGDELAADALGTLDADTEQDTARRLARRRLASATGLTREVRLRRVVAMLARKGYSTELAVRIVRELLDEEELAAGTGPSGENGAGMDSSDDWSFEDD
jgi:regulatory protein